MSTKFICDFCLQEITASYTRMNVQTIEGEDATSINEADQFEFHPSCYNSLQGVITSFREASTPEPIDPMPKEPPKQQPTNAEDPEPPNLGGGKKPDPEPTPEPTPDEPPPAG